MPTPTVGLRRLAFELRRLRADSGLSREDVAERTGINPATLYRLETAQAKPQARTLRALVELYGTDADRADQLILLSRQAARPSWVQAFSSRLPEQYATYINFEAEATSVLDYECLFVPGLLQTEDYARAALRSGKPNDPDAEIEARVEARMGRQANLNKEPPLNLWAIVDEAVLHRHVGGKAVMHDQLEHLITASDSPTLTLQVISYEAGGHPGMAGAFVIMKFEPTPDIVHIETTAADLFLEADAQVRHYQNIFEHLRALALAPSLSVALIQRIAEEL